MSRVRPEDAISFPLPFIQLVQGRRELSGGRRRVRQRGACFPRALVEGAGLARTAAARVRGLATNIYGAISIPKGEEWAPARSVLGADLLWL